MVSIPDMLKQAFEEENWSLVSQAYKSLTGEALKEQQEEVRIKDLDEPMPKSKKKNEFEMREKSESEKGDPESGSMAKREPMTIPKKGERKLDWVDDGSIAKEDSVKSNPLLGTTPKKVRTPRAD